LPAGVGPLAVWPWAEGAPFSHPAADFTAVPLGAMATPPSGFFYSRALASGGAGATVQIAATGGGANSIAIGIGANVGRIRSFGTGYRGLAISPPRKNWVPNSGDPGSFNNARSGSWTVDAAHAAPLLDSSGVGFLAVDNSASNHLDYLTDGGAIGNVPCAYFFFVLGDTTGIGKPAAAFLGASGGTEVDYTPGAAWQRVSRVEPANATNKIYSPCDYSFGSQTGNGVGARPVYNHFNIQTLPYIDDAVVTTGSVSTEDGDGFGPASVTRACDGGRLTVAWDFHTLVGSTTAAALGWTLPIWQRPLTGDECRYDPATGLVTTVIGARTWVTFLGFTFNAGDRIQLLTAQGGGPTAQVDRIYVQVGTGAPQLLGTSGAPSAAMSGSDPLYFLGRQNPATPSHGAYQQWPCTLAVVQPQARGFLPAWAAPSLLNTPNLRGLWLETGIVSAGGRVSQWTDASGNGSHFVQATPGRQPALTSVRGLPAWRSGVDTGVARFMVATLPSFDLNDSTVIFWGEAETQVDTTRRVLLDSNAATFRLSLQANGTASVGNGEWLTFDAATEGAGQDGPLIPSSASGQAMAMVLYGLAGEMDAVWNGTTGTNQALFQPSAPAGTITSLTAGIDAAHADDSLAAEMKWKAMLVASPHLTPTQQQVALATACNAANGYLLVADTNSQGAPGNSHVTSAAETYPLQIAKQSAKWVEVRSCGTSGIVTGGTPDPPQPDSMISRFAANTAPNGCPLFLRRFYLLQELMNDLQIHGGSSDPNDVSYAPTAWGHYKTLSDMARLAGFQRIIMYDGIPSTNAAPANLENLRQAANALIAAHWQDVSPTTGLPYADVLRQWGSSDRSVSICGRVTDCANTALYYDQQHVTAAVHAYEASVMAPILDALAAAMT
jgi:hypothetical protein